jgi:excisionase family DNA binding protein
MRKKPMLTVRQAAERLGVRESSIRIWAAQGRFEGAKHEETPMGSYWLIPEAQVDGFEKRGRGRPPKSQAEKSQGKKRVKA